MRETPRKKSLGKYDLLRQIGYGGMGELYLARARGMAGFEKLVAIKCLLPHLARDENSRRMFLNEARLSGCLDHPNIVHVHEIGEQEGQLFLVMEYVPGADLDKILHIASMQGERLSIDEVVTIGCDLASGLHYAHECTDADGQRLGVVHRDVSPPNVLISNCGVAKLTDFGVAKVRAYCVTSRMSGVRGRLAYMAPEQCMEERVDGRTDVFAAGVVLHEMITNQRLFWSPSDGATVSNILRGEVAPPSLMRAECPVELDAIVLRALAYNPTDRHQNAAELESDLEGLAAFYGLNRSRQLVAETVSRLAGQPNDSPLPRSRRVLRKHLQASTETVPNRRRVWGTVVAAVCALAALAAVAAAGRSEERATGEQRATGDGRPVAAKAPTPQSEAPRTAPAPLPSFKLPPPAPVRALSRQGADQPQDGHAEHRRDRRRDRAEHRPKSPRQTQHQLKTVDPEAFFPWAE
jgi:serine/threonine protein kinase